MTPTETNADAVLPTLSVGDVIRVPQYDHPLRVSHVGANPTEGPWLFIVEPADDHNGGDTTLIRNRSSGRWYLCVGTRDLGRVDTVDVVTDEFTSSDDDPTDDGPDIWATSNDTDRRLFGVDEDENPHSNIRTDGGSSDDDEQPIAVYMSLMGWTWYVHDVEETYEGVVDYTDEGDHVTEEVTRYFGRVNSPMEPSGEWGYFSSYDLRIAHAWRDDDGDRTPDLPAGFGRMASEEVR